MYSVMYIVQYPTSAMHSSPGRDSLGQRLGVSPVKGCQIAVYMIAGWWFGTWLL